MSILATPPLRATAASYLESEVIAPSGTASVRHAVRGGQLGVALRTGAAGTLVVEAVPYATTSGPVTGVAREVLRVTSSDRGTATYLPEAPVIEFRVTNNGASSVTLTHLLITDFPGIAPPQIASIEDRLATTLRPPLITTHHTARTTNATGVTADVSGYASAMIVVTGTFVGQVHVAGRFTGGHASMPLPVIDVSTGQLLANGQITTAGAYRVDLTGVGRLECRTEAMASGSVTVESRATSAPFALGGPIGGTVRYDKSNPMGLPATRWEIRDTEQQSYTFQVSGGRVFDQSFAIDSTLDQPVEFWVLRRFRGVGGSLRTGADLMLGAHLTIAAGGRLELVPSLAGVAAAVGGAIGTDENRIAELGALREPGSAITLIIKAAVAPTSGEISIEHTVRQA